MDRFRWLEFGDSEPQPREEEEGAPEPRARDFLARGIPVVSTTSPNVCGRSTSAFKTMNALSTTPTPDTLSIVWELYPTY